MHTQTEIRCTCNAGPTGKIQSNLKNKQKKEPFFCGKSKASGNIKPQTDRKSKWSLSGLPSRCIISKTRVFCSEGYFSSCSNCSLHGGSELLFTIRATVLLCKFSLQIQHILCLYLTLQMPWVSQAP